MNGAFQVEVGMGMLGSPSHRARHRGAQQNKAGEAGTARFPPQTQMPNLLWYHVASSTNPPQVLGCCLHPHGGALPCTQTPPGPTPHVRTAAGLSLSERSGGCSSRNLSLTLFLYSLPVKQAHPGCSSLGDRFFSHRKRRRKILVTSGC